MNVMTVHIVGGGLAGCEAAWQILKSGHRVILHEMRPHVTTAAHQTGNLAELVCSNSLKSMSKDTAPGLLKGEMEAFDSLILKAAHMAKVPAGQALAVDRNVFSAAISDALASSPLFTVENSEVTELPSIEEMEQKGEYWIVATGPLTSGGMVKALEAVSPSIGQRFFFYDAIAPVLSSDSIDRNYSFFGSRYDKDEGQGEGDYLNLPLTREEYEAFVEAVRNAEYMPLHAFEDTKYFEACLPIEVMVERGPETLRFGPMKPVGLTDPRTGKRPWANVQLRRENLEGTMYSMVGFQTKMKWPEQKRVFSMIPALREAEFLRFGSVHRNTYVRSPEVLASDLSLKGAARIFLAGQLTGVEGYTESAAIGLLAAKAVVARISGSDFVMPPKNTMLGALGRYVTEGGLGNFQPMNANLGLLPSLERQKGQSKADKKMKQCALARQSFAQYHGSLSSGISL